jgi:hypothetical protein
VSDSAARRRVSWPVAAWVAILILTGGFQIYRGAPVDGAVFLAMAGALILDLAGILPEPRTTEWRPSRIILIGVLGAAAVVLALTPRHGIGDGIAIAISGILVFLVAWPQRAAPAGSAWTPRMRRTATLWAGVGIAICLWELTMFFLGAYVDRNAFPALSDLLDPLLDQPIGRILFAAGWLVGGVALLRRGQGRAEAQELISRRIR